MCVDSVQTFGYKKKKEPKQITTLCYSNDNYIHYYFITPNIMQCVSNKNNCKILTCIFFFNFYKSNLCMFLLDVLFYGQRISGNV